MLQSQEERVREARARAEQVEKRVSLEAACAATVERAAQTAELEAELGRSR